MPESEHVMNLAHTLDPEAWVSYSGKEKSFKQAMEVRRNAAIRAAKNAVGEPSHPGEWHTTVHDVQARYENDAAFHSLVNCIMALAIEHKYTPSEIRDAGFMASLKIECMSTRRYVIGPGASMKVRL
jgi:predicted P-loop ATPase